jgi:hypothetical protein
MVKVNFAAARLLNENGQNKCQPVNTVNLSHLEINQEVLNVNTFRRNRKQNSKVSYKVA